MAEHKGFQDLVADAKKKITEISPTDAAAKSKSSDYSDCRCSRERRMGRGTHSQRGPHEPRNVELEVEDKFPDRNMTIICHCGAAAVPRSRPKVCKRWANKTSAPWPAVSRPGKRPVYQRPNRMRNLVFAIVFGLMAIGVMARNLR